MTAYQEPKYEIKDGKLINRIPDDEPIFVLRARDRLAVRMLQGYLTWAKDLGADMLKSVTLRRDQFRNWAEAHSERMKYPDTKLDDGWTDQGTPPS